VTISFAAFVALNIHTWFNSSAHWLRPQNKWAFAQNGFQIWETFKRCTVGGTQGLGPVTLTGLTSKWYSRYLLYLWWRHAIY